MTILRALFLAAWLAVLVLMVIATAQIGAMAGVTTFFDDFAHPWRAQFNGDFLVHLILLAAWVFYRESSPAGRILCSAGTLFFGGAFSFLYIALAARRSGGDMRTLLLGRDTPDESGPNPVTSGRVRRALTVPGSLASAGMSIPEVATHGTAIAWGRWHGHLGQLSRADATLRA